MLSQLIESGRPIPRRGPQGFLSLAFHLALGIGAIRASRVVVIPATTPVVDTQLVFTPSETRVPPTPQPTAEPSPFAAPATPTQFAMPLARIDLPTDIPPVETSRPVEPGRFVSLPGGAECGTCPAGRDSVGVFTESTVDEPVQPMSQPRPVYPRGFESLGVSGRVTVEFVVTTSGTVEAGSIRVLEATAPAFGSSAIEAIGGSRFRPARVRGVPVKQLVRQVIRFEASR